MKQVFVSVPGPWWTRLLYLHDTPIKLGVRVLVPLGRSTRVGLTVAAEGIPVENNSIKLKPITKIIDSVPPIPEELMKTMEWFSNTWFSGLGIASKVMFPTKFLDGEELCPLTEYEKNNPDNYRVNYIYEENDAKRYERYAEIAKSSSAGTMFLFSEADSAKKFWNLLPSGLKEEGIIWPTGATKQWTQWKEARNGNVKFIVGSQSAAFVPLKGLSRIIIEDENSGGWLTQKNPCFHHRSVLAARAKFSNAELILGGRIASSKAFMQNSECGKEKKDIQKRLIFVNLHDSSSFTVDAVKDSLPISKPLIRETLTCRENSKWAFWILDRKGYAGELYCRDCGEPLRCSHCVGVMRWEGKQKRLSCLSCKHHIPIPEKCPSCGGPFLEGVRPGLEALTERASLILRYKYKEVLLFQNESGKLPSCKSLIKDYPRGALVVGTRKILALTDELPTGMIGWIDADAEARITEYDAKARAFALLYESFWRGMDPERRKIVIQSRRPDRGWQKGLTRGWSYFWKTELKERKEWNLPPYSPMLKMVMPKGTGIDFAKLLDKESLEYWAAEESSDEIWVRTRKFSIIKKYLAPYFDIKNTRRGFPVTRLYLD
ncbi:MAG: hypothetical protein GXZ18_06635 [Synergistaceae bacterium]|nr:hypothetical protein [Synergistaceae bacterium]